MLGSHPLDLGEYEPTRKDKIISWLNKNKYYLNLKRLYKKIPRKYRIGTIYDKIRYKYWDILPYDYRPGQIKYRIKCYLFKRYTTVKPRYLGHTWCDRSHLLPHVMFEILSDFVEKELDYKKDTFPGIVDWYSGHAKIKVDSGDKLVIDEMIELYEWWHSVQDYEPHAKWHEWRKLHTKEKDEDDEFTVAEVDEYGDPTLYNWDGPEWDSEENELEGDRLLKEAQKAEKDFEEKFEENLIRLVKVRRWMWT
jgi:hypothetical protein